MLIRRDVILRTRDWQGGQGDRQNGTRPRPPRSDTIFMRTFGAFCANGGGAFFYGEVLPGERATPGRSSSSSTGPIGWTGPPPTVRRIRWGS